MLATRKPIRRKALCSPVGRPACEARAFPPTDAPSAEPPPGCCVDRRRFEVRFFLPIFVLKVVFNAIVANQATAPTGAGRRSSRSHNRNVPATVRPVLVGYFLCNELSVRPGSVGSLLLSRARLSGRRVAAATPKHKHNHRSDRRLQGSRPNPSPSLCHGLARTQAAHSQHCAGRERSPRNLRVVRVAARYNVPCHGQVKRSRTASSSGAIGLSARWLRSLSVRTRVIAAELVPLAHDEGANGERHSTTPDFGRAIGRQKT